MCAQGHLRISHDKTKIVRKSSWGFRNNPARIGLSSERDLSPNHPWHFFTEKIAPLRAETYFCTLFIRPHLYEVINLRRNLYTPRWTNPSNRLTNQPLPKESIQHFDIPFTILHSWQRSSLLSFSRITDKDAPIIVFP